MVQTTTCEFCKNKSAVVIEHKKYFLEHPINSLPQKFISRFGELFECKLLKSYVDVFEYWKKIYENSGEYT